jgi:hypothetical protein
VTNQFLLDLSTFSVGQLHFYWAVCRVKKINSDDVDDYDYW